MWPLLVNSIQTANLGVNAKRHQDLYMEFVSEAHHQVIDTTDSQFMLLPTLIKLMVTHANSILIVVQALCVSNQEESTVYVYVEGK